MAAAAPAPTNPYAEFMNSVKIRLSVPITEDSAKALTQVVQGFLDAAGTEKQPADSHGLFKDGVTKDTNPLELFGVLYALGKGKGLGKNPAVKPYGLAISVLNATPTIEYWNSERVVVFTVVEGPGEAMPELTPDTLDFWASKAVASYAYSNDKFQLFMPPGSALHPVQRYPLPVTDKQLEKASALRRKYAPTTMEKVTNQVQMFYPCAGCEQVIGGRVDVVQQCTLKFMQDLSKLLYVYCDRNTEAAYVCGVPISSDSEISEVVLGIMALKQFKKRPVEAEKKPRKRRAVATDDEPGATEGTTEGTTEGAAEGAEEDEEDEEEMEAAREEEEAVRAMSRIGFGASSLPDEVVRASFWADPRLPLVPSGLSKIERNIRLVTKKLSTLNINLKHPFFGQVLATAMSMPRNDDDAGKVVLLETGAGPVAYMQQGSQVLFRCIKYALKFMALVTSISNIVPMVGKRIPRKEDGTLDFTGCTEYQVKQATILDIGSKHPVVPGFEEFDEQDRRLALATAIGPNTLITNISRHVLAKKNKPWDSEEDRFRSIQASLLGKGTIAFNPETNMYIAYVNSCMGQNRPDFLPWKVSSPGGLVDAKETWFVLAPGTKLLPKVDFKTYNKEGKPSIKNNPVELIIVDAAPKGFQGLSSEPENANPIRTKYVVPVGNMALLDEQCAPSSTARMDDLRTRITGAGLGMLAGGGRPGGTHAPGFTVTGDSPVGPRVGASAGAGAGAGVGADTDTGTRAGAGGAGKYQTTGSGAEGSSVTPMGYTS